MRVETIRKLVKIRGTLLSKGFVIVPRERFIGNLSEQFINEKFRVEMDVLGNVSSKIEWHTLRLINQCKEYWYNKSDTL